MLGGIANLSLIHICTLLSAIKAEPGDGTIDTDAVVSQVKSIMVPTTTEIYT